MEFKKIFWGFMFFINIRIFGLNILPTVIGCTLIYGGLSKLLHHSEHFIKAQKLISIMAYAYIPNIINLKGVFMYDLLMSIGLILYVFMISYLYSGINDMATYNYDNELLKELKICQNVFTLLFVSYLISLVIKTPLVNVVTISLTIVHFVASGGLFWRLSSSEDYSTIV